MKVLLLGGSGFIGRHLATALQKRGDEVVRLSLRDPAGAAIVAATCDAVVNLAGETVAQRWNGVIKDRIVYSRTELPRRFLSALSVFERKDLDLRLGIGHRLLRHQRDRNVRRDEPARDRFLGRSLRRLGRTRVQGARFGIAHVGHPHRPCARSRRRRAGQAVAAVPAGAWRENRERTPVVFMDPYRRSSGDLSRGDGCR